MKIAENSAQRITLVQNDGPLGVFFYLWFVVFGAPFTVIGLWLLFAQVSEFVVPAWAEWHRLSGRRWHSEGSEVPTSLAVSIAISLVWTAASVFFLWFGGTRLLFSMWRRLDFDFSNGEVILKRRGLFRCSDLTHPISGTFARIEEGDDDGSKYQALRVTTVANDDRWGWSNLLPWRRTLWLERIEPDQVKTLGRLL